MKKLILPVVLAASICTANTSFAAYSFSDISASQYSWCAPQIEEMAKAEYVSGYEDGTYRPDNEVTKLEGIALFARAMGSRDEVNKETLSLAHTQYDSALSTCSLSWGEDELAYMLYKGAFTGADLTTYIAGDMKNMPMTRGEAAVIITKAMGGEAKATSVSGVKLDYKDASEIPSNILQYVKYVTDEGIMQGVDYEFLADGTVTRSQIAVMLARVVEKCDYSFEKASFIKYDDESDLVTLKIDGDEEEYEINGDIKTTIKGEQTHIGNLPENVSVIAQFTGDKLAALDALSDKADEIVTATYSSQSILGGYTQIKVKDNKTGLTRTFMCIDNVPVTYAGSPATLKSLKSGDTVTLTVADGKVQAISAAEKAVTISNAVVESLDINDDNELVMTISSTNDEYDGQSYIISDSVSVTKNSKDSEMSEIYVGDKVTITMSYGEVTKVAATSTTSTVSGTLVELTISNQPSITVKVDGKNKTYVIPQNCTITINEKEGSLYDFRVGDSMVLTTQSEAVTKIKCSTSVATTSGRVDGTVTAVNTSYGFISVITDGSDVPITVFCSDAKTKFANNSGTSLAMKKIAVGDYVECRGTTSNGAFVSTFVIVTAAAD